MSDFKKTLRDTDMTTVQRPERRRMLGLLGLGMASVAATGGPALAQASDADNGEWADAGSCPRGPGGEYTGVTDADSGSITDNGGYGRGAPYC